jgi:hypothetical protein
MRGDATPLDMDARPIQPSDFSDVANFLARTFGNSCEAFLELLFWLENNPARNDDQPRGWLVRSPDQEPIAFTSNIPFSYIINGRNLNCFATGNTSVAPEWRGKKLSKIVAKAFLSQNNADLLIGTDSTAIAYQLWLSLGMKPLTRQWAPKIFRIVANARRLMSMQPIVPGILRPALGTTVAAVTAIARKKVLGRARSIKVKKLDSFDISGSGQIETFRADNSADTYAVRNSTVLTWMYFGCETVRRTRAVFAATDGDRIIGYLAMKLVGSSYFLLECRCKDASPEIACALILAARDYADLQGAFFLNVWRYTNMIYEAVPSLCGTSFRSPQMMTYCYYSNVGIIDERKWESTPGDGDLSVN